MRREAALDAWADDGRWAHTTWWNEVEGGTRRLVLFEPFEIRGEVIDARGMPIAGAALYLVSRHRRYLRLDGPDGTTVDVVVQRPDGSTARASLTRECL